MTNPQFPEPADAGPAFEPNPVPPPPAQPGPPPQFGGLPAMKTRRRSRFWPVYAVIAVLCWIAFLAHPGQFGFGGVFGNILISAYAVYVYRGGRWIIF